MEPSDAIVGIAQVHWDNNVRSISIDGVVRSPGTYSLKTGMNVKDLILEAGGVSEDVYRYNIEIARIDPQKVSEKTFAETIELDMDNDYTLVNVKHSLTPIPAFYPWNALSLS